MSSQSERSGASVGSDAGEGATPRLTRRMFAYQAVRFSLYTPVLMSAVNWLLRESVGGEHPGAIGFAVVSILMIAAAFCFGIVGAAASFRPFAAWDILLGIVGTLVNALFLFAVVWLML